MSCSVLLYLEQRPHVCLWRESKWFVAGTWGGRETFDRLLVNPPGEFMPGQVCMSVFTNPEGRQRLSVIKRIAYIVDVYGQLRGENPDT